jgi:hypothetical protein
MNGLRRNEDARLIHNLDAGFKEMKNGKNHLKNDLSRWVVPTFEISNHAFLDLLDLSTIKTGHT